MSEDYEDEVLDSEESEDEYADEDNVEDVSEDVPNGKFDKIISEGEKRYKLSGMFREWFIDYASYVMLERAVPHIEDGLKPVQRRILHALKINEDGRYHKVAGIVGDTMKFHPHGDASIYDALVQIQQKELIVDGQGNWGNILTGDRAAAMRYIEAKLSKFANEVVFNPKITDFTLTYDGVNKEPVCLPIKFPLLLFQGTKGIAVGLKVNILPHNFNELIDACIDVLKGNEVNIYPDFPTAGTADCSKYNGGRKGGRVRIRATITKRDKKTLVISDIPFEQTTGSVIDSIISANNKGKIKIKKIDDLTSDKTEIVIQLANDISPDKTIDALYAFTKCASTISTNSVVIKDGKPEFLSVNEILNYSALHTKELFQRELRVTLAELEGDWHYLSLEKIFFENKIYRILENEASTWEEQINDVEAGLKKFQHLLKRSIVKEDVLKLVEKPVRKISKFDIKAADEKIKGIEADMDEVNNNLEHLTEFVIRYYTAIKKKYGQRFQRRTKLEEFEDIQAQKVVVANAKLYADMKEGFVGLDAKKMDNAEYVSDCSDIDDIIVFMKNGDYIVTSVKDKAFIGKEIIHVSVFKKGDERTIYNATYRDGKNGDYFVKRFCVKGISKDKMYNLTQGKENSSVVWFTANTNGEAEVIKIFFKPKPKLRKLIVEYDFATLAVKGRGSRGNVLAKNPIQKIILKTKGVSTIGGKQIWFDGDINRLNDSERGIFLGEFLQNEKVLAIYKNGRYCTTSFDLSNRYQGEIERIEKFNPKKIFSAIYYERASKYFYIKRFKFETSDNSELCFISEISGSYLVALSDDRHPQIELTFKGKNKNREPEIIDVEEFIAVKGLKAKGKRVSPYDIDTVLFIAPLIKEGDDNEVDEEVDNDEPIELIESESSDVETDTDDAEKEQPSQDGEKEPENSDNDEDSIELTLF